MNCLTLQRGRTLTSFCVCSWPICAFERGKFMYLDVYVIRLLMAHLPYVKSKVSGPERS